MEEQQTIYFIRNYKFILKEYGPVVSSFLGYLIDQDELRKNTRKKYSGSFFLSRTQIAENTTIKRKGQMSCEKILSLAGFINIETKDHNANQYTIDYKAINDAYQLAADKTEVIEKPLKTADPYNGDPTEDNSLPTLESAPAPDSSKEGLPTAEGVNYIMSRSLSRSVGNPKNTNSTDALKDKESKLELETAGIKHTKNSCIKKSLSPMPPARKAAHNWQESKYPTDHEVDVLIQKYNEAMGITWAPGDRTKVIANLSIVKEVEKDFSPFALEYVWENYPDEKTRKLSRRSIAAFIGFGLIENLIEHHTKIYAVYSTVLDLKLTKVFKYYQNKVNEIANPMGYICNEFGELEPRELYHQSSPTGFTQKERRDVGYSIYKKNIHPLILPEEDLHDMIINIKELV